ncbi:MULTISPECIES: MogA/MoaB family molybdenum cofactor biosynthesis protein [Microbacterium]|uniref:MogA/MoaB family molybdenum cofactor biosynthesis protein n=1 Tax=Microbacterium TaxID=33882 RepID=UPI0030105B5C
MSDTTPHDAVRAAVLTVSDRSAAGERPDAAGPVAVAALRASGFACDDALVVADGADSVAAGLRRLLAGGTRLVVTSGGTGIAPRDQTPEGTMQVLDRTLPGIAEELRRQSAAIAPGALLSRGVAGVSGTALIVNLPGSPKAVAEGMPLVLSLARHALDQLTGGDH